MYKQLLIELYLGDWKILVDLPILHPGGAVIFYRILSPKEITTGIHGPILQTDFLEAQNRIYLPSHLRFILIFFAYE